MAGYQGSATRRDQQEALSAAIESERREMMTALPGTIGGYGAKQRASIKPRLKQKFGKKVLEAPTLEDVPVLHPRGGGFTFHMPMKSGDEVMLVFAQRSMDRAGADGTAADGRPGRMNQISDAVAIPASHSSAAAASGLPTDRMHIGTDDGKGGLQVTPAGKFDVVSNGETLMTVIEEFIAMFRDHLTAGVPHDKVGDAAALLARVQAMKG